MSEIERDLDAARRAGEDARRSLIELQDATGRWANKVARGQLVARWVETCLLDCNIRPLGIGKPLAIDGSQVIQDIYGARRGTRVRTYVVNTPRGWRDALCERTGGLRCRLDWTMTTAGQRVRYIEMLVPAEWVI